MIFLQNSSQAEGVKLELFITVVQYPGHGWIGRAIRTMHLQHVAITPNIRRVSYSSGANQSDDRPSLALAISTSYGTDDRANRSARYHSLTT